MEPDGIVLGRLITVAFVRYYVYYGHQVGGYLCLIEGIFKLPEVVTVNGAEVSKAHLVPKHSGQDEAFNTVVKALYELVYQLTRGDSL